MRSVLLVLLPVLVAAPAAGQTLRGAVLESGTRVPVPGAAVILRAAGDSSGREVLSDSAGLFRFARVGAGRYTVAVRALGYDGAAVDTLRLTGQPVFLEIQLSPSPIALEGLEVRVESLNPFLRDRGFYERRERGHGTFLRPEDVAALKVVEAAELLRRVPSVRLIRINGNDEPVIARGRNSFASGTCLPGIVVDGQFVRVRSDPWGRPFHFVAPPPEMIDAIEVYPGPATVPLQWKGTGAACGLIVIWTKH